MKRLAAALAALIVSFAAAAQDARYAERPEVRAFVRQLVERHGFAEAELLKLFGRAQRTDAVLQAMQAPAERVRSWEEYRAIFVNERRVDAGLAFWEAQGEPLARVASLYGVPEEIIVAIIGVETFYGRNTGRWRVLDALATLAFDYPPRASYFRNELENYLVLAREARLDVFGVRGSYAGAIGIPQFMPGSALRYAVDFDGDGRIDLQHSAADAIGSVANYLRQHGWQPDGPVLLEARVTEEAQRRYADGSVVPKHALGEMLRGGIVPMTPAHGLEQLPAVLVELRTPEQPSDFRIGFRNFYVITRYNRSAFYASAVADLARALRAARP
jgi:membrane-bound lytic murein transglycosylase B